MLNMPRDLCTPAGVPHDDAAGECRRCGSPDPLAALKRRNRVAAPVDIRRTVTRRPVPAPHLHADTLGPDGRPR